MRLYQKSIGVKFTGSTYRWAEVDYSGILLKDGTTVPDSVSITNPWSYDVTGTQSGTKTFTFMSPEVYDVAQVVDGTITGTLKFYAQAASTGSGYGRITRADVALSKVSAGGDEVGILDETVWTGTLQANLGQTVSLGVMFWTSASGVMLAYNERLKMIITLHYSTLDSNSQGRSIGLYCSANNEETSITVPFILR